MSTTRNTPTLAVALEMWREFTTEGRQALIDALEAGLPSEAVACSVADAAARILRAAAEPEAKRPPRVSDEEHERRKPLPPHVLLSGRDPAGPKAVSGSEPGGFLPCKCGTAAHCAIHYDEHGDRRW